MSNQYKRAYIEITNVCNMSCSFCHGTRREPRLMSLTEFRKIAAQVREYTDFVFLHVLGEPLLHPELFLMIEYAKEIGLRVAITTNGTLLPKVGSGLIAAAPYKVQISLHSFEQGDSVRHDRYLDGCLDFAAAASEVGILTVLRLWNRGFDSGKNTYVENKIRERFPSDIREEGRGLRLGEKLHLEWGDRFIWPDISLPDLGGRVFCHGMKDQFAILSDGTVTACCLDSDGAIALGNAYETSLGDILTSERALAIKEGFGRKEATEELCRRCGYARRFKL